MATHRSHDKGFAPDFDLQVAISILEASEVLAARRRQLTPQTLARQLRAQPLSMRPTRAQIERGLAQVQCWRDQIFARAILHHRQQLIEMSVQLRAQQQQLVEDLFYLDKMLEVTNELLKNTLIKNGDENAYPAPASANAARPLQ